MSGSSTNTMSLLPTNPFKPGQPVEPIYFGGRHLEIETFQQYLQYTISGNQQNLAVLGDPGIGKTSLLRMYENIAREQACITVRREFDSSVNSLQTLSSFLLQALKTEGSSNLPRKTRTLTKVKSFFDTYNVGVGMMGVQGSIGATGVQQVAVQDTFYKDLTSIWKGVQGHNPAIVYLLDEAVKLQNIDGAWGFLRSVFTRIAESGAKYMIVISGKLDLYKKITQIFEPAERFFVPLELGPLKYEETREALEKPLIAHKRTINDDAVGLIQNRSDGHPYVIQTFGFYAFESKTTPITSQVIDKITPRVMTRLSSQLFKNRFSKTTDEERRVLLVLADLESGKSAGPKVIAERTGQSEDNVSQFLKRLMVKDCVQKLERGEYKLFNPLFGDYVRVEMPDILHPDFKNKQ